MLLRRQRKVDKLSVRHRLATLRQLHASARCNALGPTYLLKQQVPDVLPHGHLLAKTLGRGRKHLPRMVLTKDSDC